MPKLKVEEEEKYLETYDSIIDVYKYFYYNHVFIMELVNGQLEPVALFNYKFVQILWATFWKT